LALISASPGTEEDVSQIDRAPATQSDHLEAHATPRSNDPASIRAARGEIVFGEARVQLDRAAKGDVYGRVTGAKNLRDVKLVPWLDLLGVAKKEARVLFGARVSRSSPAGTGKVSATLEIIERDGGATIGKHDLGLTVEVLDEARAPDAALIELDRRAYLYHQKRAQEAYDRLPALHDYLRLDRVDPPPPPARVKGKEGPALEQFLHHRLRADFMLERLHIAADARDEAIAELAARAIGSLSAKPTGAAAKASAIEAVTIAKGLSMAIGELDDLHVDEAEGFVLRLRKSGRLERAELAQALAIQGAIDVVRGKSKDAEQHFGQALCVQPDVKIALRRAFMARELEAARRSPNACKKPVTVQTVTAQRASVDGKLSIVVDAAFAPDPEQLVAGGDVELWGAGGALRKTDRVRAQGGKLEAAFEDTGDLENYAGQLLLKVFLRDVSGVVLASWGDPDPMAVSVAKGNDVIVEGFPSWVWWLAGGVAIAGAATVGVVLLTNRETKHGIGPVTAEF
jgi:hypothetical protein